MPRFRLIYPPLPQPDTDQSPGKRCHGSITTEKRMTHLYTTAQKVASYSVQIDDRPHRLCARG